MAGSYAENIMYRELEIRIIKFLEVSYKRRNRRRTSQMAGIDPEKARE